MVINRFSAISNLWNEGFIEIRSFDREIFSQGMPLKTIPEQNPSQVRVILKGNSEEVIHLSF
jgi:hypothetical protein